MASKQKSTDSSSTRSKTPAVSDNRTVSDTTTGRGRRPAAGQAPKRRPAAPKTDAANRPTTPKKGRNPHPKAPELPVKITFLGGLNEIGKNMTMVEYGDDAILIDCGMSFPDEDMPGVDIVLADYTWVEKNKERIRGIVVTHGHEDHIGGLPYLLKQVNLPIYAAKLTLALIESKLQEFGLQKSAQLNEVKAGTVVPFGAISVEFIPVNHSIPDAMALGIKTPLGYVVHTGDFKIDCTPISGKMIDLTRFGEMGREGVLALMADSTNAERPGYTPSERTVGDSFATLFPKAEGKRMIIATFSSNLHRIQQIIDAADHYGRKVAISGRSMVNYVTIAIELGYLRCPEGLMIDIDLINRYPKEQITLITTGSQGEPMSALSRMAFSDHRKVEVGPDDYIIISANPIPGNEKMVGRVVDELFKRGCEVVYERMYEVHVSGHACREELKIIQGLTNPRYFFPVHGEQKHLQKHAELAYAMGMEKKNVLIADIGQVVELTRDKMEVTGTVPAGRVLVDGLGVGDVGSVVLRDRRHLSEDGLLVVVAAIDSIMGQVVSGPDIVSRGFVYVKESEELIDEARELAYRVLAEECRNHADWTTMKNRLRDDLSRMVFQRTKRSPMILPILMDG